MSSDDKKRVTINDQNPFFKTFHAHLVKGSKDSLQQYPRTADKNLSCPPKNQTNPPGGCAGQIPKIASSTANLQSQLGAVSANKLSNFQRSSGVNVQGCVDNNFDTNAQVLWGAASAEIADDTSVGCEQEAIAASLMMASTNALSCQVANVCNDVENQSKIKITQRIEFSNTGSIVGNVNMTQSQDINLKITMTDSIKNQIQNHINQNISNMIQNLQKTSQSRSSKGVGGTAATGQISATDSSQSSNMMALSQQMNNVSNKTEKELNVLMANDVVFNNRGTVVGDITIEQTQKVIMAAALSTVYSNVVSSIADQSVQNALKNIQDQQQSEKAVGADQGLPNMSKQMMIIAAVVIGIGLIGGCIAAVMHHKKKPQVSNLPVAQYAQPVNVASSTVPNVKTNVKMNTKTPVVKGVRVPS